MIALEKEKPDGLIKAFHPRRSSHYFTHSISAGISKYESRACPSRDYITMGVRVMGTASILIGTGCNKIMEDNFCSGCDKVVRLISAQVN